MSNQTVTFPRVDDGFPELVRGSKHPVLQPIQIVSELSFGLTMNLPGHGREEVTLPEADAIVVITAAFMTSISSLSSTIGKSEVDSKSQLVLAQIAKAFVEVLVETHEVRERAFVSLMEALKTKDLNGVADELLELILPEMFANYAKRILED